MELTERVQVRMRAEEAAAQALPLFKPDKAQTPSGTPRCGAVDDTYLTGAVSWLTL